MDLASGAPIVAVLQTKDATEAGGVPGRTVDADAKSGAGTQISEKAGGGGVLGNDEIGVAIVIEIGDGRAALLAVNGHAGFFT